MNELLSVIKGKNQKGWEQFGNCMSDFQKIEDIYEKELSPWGYENKIAIKEKEQPLHYMVFLTLVSLKGFNYLYQPMEKIEWIIPFKFEGKRFSFSKEKFGIRLKTYDADQEITERMLKNLNSGVRITDRLIKPLIEDLVNDGQFTLQNRFSILRERYLFFRQKAESSYKQVLNPKLDTVSNLDVVKILSNFLNQSMEYEKEGFFYTQAMLDAYFSFLEHFLVLLLPFSDFDKEQDDIAKFIGNEWTKKYNRIFKQDEKKIIMKHYDNLQNIKERFRNTFAHGGFEKRNGSLFVHFYEIGAVPIQLSQFRESVNFSFLPVKELDLYEISKAIDDFEAYLTTSDKWARPMLILDSGSDIHFDEEYIQKYKLVVKSDESLAEFLEYEAYLYEKFANMDW